MKVDIKIILTGAFGFCGLLVIGGLATNNDGLTASGVLLGALLIFGILAGKIPMK